MRFLEAHEARSNAHADRVLRDLGDCLLLYAPRDPDPFVNRVTAVRWPRDPGAFDHRIAEIVTLFGSLGRRPCLWTAPAFNTPADLPARLVAHGFREHSRGHMMVLARRPVEPAALPPEVAVERIAGGTGPGQDRVAGLARLLVEALGAQPGQAPAVAAETAAALRSSALHVVVVRQAGVAVAVGKRFTADGASYLSSIGTLPGQRGRGHGRLVTETLVRDSLAEGSRWVLRRGRPVTAGEADRSERSMRSTARRESRTHARPSPRTSGLLAPRQA